MSFTPEQNAFLAGPLNADVVRKNPKGFDYLEGWHTIAEMNRVFGHDGWSREMMDLTLVGTPYQDAKQNWRVGYRATVRITIHADERPVVRDGTGYGSGIVKDLNDAHEGAVKEAETDAMKRALMTLGNPFGLALYDKERANVEAPLLESTRVMLAAIADCANVTALKTWLAANRAAALASADSAHITNAYNARLAALTPAQDKAA